MPPVSFRLSLNGMGKSTFEFSVASGSQALLCASAEVKEIFDYTPIIYRFPSLCLPLKRLLGAHGFVCCHFPLECSKMFLLIVAVNLNWHVLLSVDSALATEIIYFSVFWHPYLAPLSIAGKLRLL